MKASLIMVGLATAPGPELYFRRWKIDYQWESQVPTEDFPDFGFDARPLLMHKPPLNTVGPTPLSRTLTLAPISIAVTTRKQEVSARPDKSKGTLFFMRATEDFLHPWFVSSHFAYVGKSTETRSDTLSFQKEYRKANGFALNFGR
ncbi:hypothetical protein N7513_013242 [Penicillium frequentans]|nr:hypothetical protein N7513_013242 [Penicillium glabrum]